MAILSADRDTSLPELLAETASCCPRTWSRRWSGRRSTGSTRWPSRSCRPWPSTACRCPPVAVDYLLQPYLVAIDSAPVLGRLVNMQFVRRDAGRYYLHQVDRDYALSRIPEGEPADRRRPSAPFTRYALRHRGAEYFEQTRTPREAWKQLDDLAPQLAEFELRYQGEDYDTAAAVLLGYRLRLPALVGPLPADGRAARAAAGQADRPGPQAGQPGQPRHQPYADLGRDAAGDRPLRAGAGHRPRDRRPAGRSHLAGQPGQRLRRPGGDAAGDRALRAGAGHRPRDRRPAGRSQPTWATWAAATPTWGRRGGRSSSTSRRWPSPARSATGRAKPPDLGNLGNCYADLGETRRAIELYEQALAIAREIGDRAAEANAPGRPGRVLRRSWDVGTGDPALRRGHPDRGRDRLRPNPERGPLRSGAGALVSGRSAGGTPDGRGRPRLRLPAQQRHRVGNARRDPAPPGADRAGPAGVHRGGRPGRHPPRAHRRQLPGP